jgi:hypothetical protein
MENWLLFKKLNKKFIRNSISWFVIKVIENRNSNRHLNTNIHCIHNEWPLTSGYNLNIHLPKMEKQNVLALKRNKVQSFMLQHRRTSKILCCTK